MENPFEINEKEGKIEKSNKKIEIEIDFIVRLSRNVNLRVYFNFSDS